MGSVRSTKLPCEWDRGSTACKGGRSAWQGLVSLASNGLRPDADALIALSLRVSLFDALSRHAVLHAVRRRVSSSLAILGGVASGHRWQEWSPTGQGRSIPIRLPPPICRLGSATSDKNGGDSDATNKHTRRCFPCELATISDAAG